MEFNLEYCKKLFRGSGKACPDIPGFYSDASLMGRDSNRAVLEYTIYHDIPRFRFRMNEVARGQLEVYRREERGEGNGKYARIDMYTSILCACAGGDFPVAVEIAYAMGNDLKFEKSKSHVANRYKGYTLKGILTNNSKMTEEWFEKLTSYVNKSSGKSSLGYQMVMEGILKKDREIAQAGLERFVKSHLRRETGDNVTMFLCGHGIGLANLCRWQGVWVSGYTHMIPEDLLFTEDEIRERTKSLQPGVRPEGMPLDYWIKYPENPEQIAMTAPHPDDYPVDPITNYMTKSKKKK